MDEDVYAVMLEFSRSNKCISSKFELDVITTGLEGELAHYNCLWRGDDEENVTVAGIKKLPQETSIFGYLNQMKVKYGGK